MTTRAGSLVYVRVRRGYMRTYRLPISSSSFEMATSVKGLYNASSIMLNNPLTPIGSPVTHENWLINWPDFATSPARLGWSARNRHNGGMHASIFSHTQTTTRAGSLVYVRVGSGSYRAGEDICGPTDHFQQFRNGYGRKMANDWLVNGELKMEFIKLSYCSRLLTGPFKVNAPLRRVNEISTVQSSHMMQCSCKMMQEIAWPNLRSNDVNDSHALNLE